MADWIAREEEKMLSTAIARPFRRITRDTVLVTAICLPLGGSAQLEKVTIDCIENGEAASIELAAAQFLQVFMQLNNLMVGWHLTAMGNPGLTGQTEQAGTRVVPAILHHGDKTSTLIKAMITTTHPDPSELSIPASQLESLRQQLEIIRREFYPTSYGIQGGEYAYSQ